ncbi:AraC family transcriptional regulator [uncultured Pantoea sp.]|uniref:AraC family transcriptional regulator n=1 Tax=uncultured Pantoea sp. TaxID=218084 RepID=UPI0025894771|nr:AraC family transcriptional regulator [uncultured Pantoea sp.]
MIQSVTFPVDVGWQALLKDLGLRAAHVLRRAALPDDLLSGGKQSLSSQDYFRFWHALETESGDAMFPLRVIETLTTESFSPPLFAALCSPDLIQAAQRLATYKKLVCPMELILDVGRKGELTISPRWLMLQGEAPLSLQIAEIAFFLWFARLATRESVRASRVILPDSLSKSHAQGYEKFFGTRIIKGSVPSITFTAGDALRPFLTVSASMWRVFEPDLRQRLSELEATATVAERVRAVLLELLPGNTATIKNAATRLGLSQRSLQRRLAEEGVNFRELVNSTRERLARHYLGTTSMSDGEIAFLLGFADPNSFYRAFHGWTGHTVGRARQSLPRK